jgi:predicted ester cyclase
MRADIDELFSAGDRVVCRWRFSGTHCGPLEGIAPTGRQVTITGLSIARFSGDRIQETFVNWDALGLMQQLGVVTMPGKAAEAGA